MNNRFCVRLGIAALVLTVLASCTKNDATTIVPVGPESYIDSITSVVTDAAFWNDFGRINEGAIPPKIEGAFSVSPRKRVGTNVEGVPIDIDELDAILSFNRQHNGLVTMALNDATNALTDTVFVMGSGDDFTAYCIEEKSFEVLSYQVETKRGIIVKGTMTEAGIVNLRLATIVLDSRSIPEGAPLQEVGSYFIYKDGDGLAERMSGVL